MGALRVAKGILNLWSDCEDAQTDLKFRGFVIYPRYRYTYSNVCAEIAFQVLYMYVSTDESIQVNWSCFGICTHV